MTGSSMFDAQSDETFMRRAIEIAQHALGAVEPNPMVGCVVVCDGQIIGEGWHQKFGGPHAEVNALARISGSGKGSHSAQGATAYVSLEPCCHQGKTPPCTRALIDAKVARVVASVSDPFAKVAGGGFQQLRDAGVQVDVGTLAAEGQRLIAPYVKLIQHQKPWIIGKWAMTLDGKIATADGHSKWISNPQCREVVHELRSRVDAVLVGIGTALADDPMLNARFDDPRAPLRIATRIVLDSHAQLSPQSKLARSAAEQPVMVFVGETADSEAVMRLEDTGCEILNVDPRQIDLVLTELGKRRMTNVLVEGGSRILGNLLTNRQIDEAHIFIGNRIAGGERITAVGGEGFATIDQAPQIENPIIKTLGDNVYINGPIRWE